MPRFVNFRPFFLSFSSQSHLLFQLIKKAIVERKPNENITAEQLATEVLASSRDKVPAKLAEELRDRVKMAVDRAVQQAASGGK